MKVFRARSNSKDDFNINLDSHGTKTSTDNKRSALRRSRSLSPKGRTPNRNFARKWKRKLAAPEAIKFESIDDLREHSRAYDMDVLQYAYDLDNRFTNVISKFNDQEKWIRMDVSKNRSDENHPTKHGYLYHIDKSPKSKIQSSPSNPMYHESLNALTVPYINASLIKHKEFSYIATQHPMDNTIIDFWKMILIEKPCIILMLNGFEFQRDRELYSKPSKLIYNQSTIHPQYWPINEKSMEFIIPEGRIKISRDDKSESILNDTITCTYLTISFYPQDENISNITWSCWHVCCYFWRDQEVPEVSSFIELWNTVQTKTDNKNPKIVVHCTGGIGRTGTYLCIDIAANELLKSKVGSISIDEIIMMLRKYRMNMVGHCKQYAFCHKAPVEIFDKLISQISNENKSGD